MIHRWAAVLTALCVSWRFSRLLHTSRLEATRVMSTLVTHATTQAPPPQHMPCQQHDGIDGAGGLKCTRQRQQQRQDRGDTRSKQYSGGRGAAAVIVATPAAVGRRPLCRSVGVLACEGHAASSPLGVNGGVTCTTPAQSLLSPCATPFPLPCSAGTGAAPQEGDNTQAALQQGCGESLYIWKAYQAHTSGAS